MRREIRDLDAILSQIPVSPKESPQEQVAPDEPVAALMVSGYGGLGIHSLLNVQRLFPKTFQNILFVSVGAVDMGTFKGAKEMEALKRETESHLKRYVDYARALGLRAEYRYAIGTEVVQEAEELCTRITKEFPRAVFFLGKLVFAREKFYYRILHNDTAYAIQRRLQFSGLQTVVLPIRMRI